MPELNRRLGESGNGARVTFLRFWPILAVAGGLVATGAVSTYAIGENTKDIAKLQQRIETKLDQIEESSRLQATRDGRIEGMVEMLLTLNGIPVPTRPSTGD
jgi:hypothetical protein